MTDTLIDFIRHGEPLGGRMYRGHRVDHALSEKGWQQMWASVGEPQDWPWQALVSSPMQRCRAFAAAMIEKDARNRRPVTVIDALKEVGFGDWEGQTPDDLQRQRAEEYLAFYADPVNNRPQGAEPLDVFGARVGQAFDQILAEFAGQHVLVVAHAGVIRAVLGHVLNASAIGWYRAKVDNASLSRFRLGKRGLSMDFFNRVGL